MEDFVEQVDSSAEVDDSRSSNEDGQPDSDTNSWNEDEDDEEGSEEEDELEEETVSPPKKKSKSKPPTTPTKNIKKNKK